MKTGTGNALVFSAAILVLVLNLTISPLTRVFGEEGEEE